MGTGGTQEHGEIFPYNFKRINFIKKGGYDFCKPRLRTASNWERRVHYAGREPAAAAAAGSKQVRIYAINIPTVFYSLFSTIFKANDEFLSIKW